MARSPVERKSMSETSQPATKQGEVRNRVLDLIEQLGVGDAIPSERQLTGAGLAEATATIVHRVHLLLRVIGSPDPYGKQIDGMGAATSSTSKTVILAASTRPDHDVGHAHVGLARVVAQLVAGAQRTVVRAEDGPERNFQGGPPFSASSAFRHSLMLSKR